MQEWSGLERLAAFFLTHVISELIHYLSALLYGFVIPTNKAGNTRPHSVGRQKGRDPFPGS